MAMRIRGSKILPSWETENSTDLFEEAQQQLINMVRDFPTLKLIAAKKLKKLVEELADFDLEAQPVNADAEPLEKIKHGFLKFKQHQFLKKPDVFNKLANGQRPKFMVIACSDSRVCPSNILCFQPGEAFMVRNVANMIPPWEQDGFQGTSAALEYAVLHLKVEHILVMGHSRCGGIKALMSMSDEGNKSSEFIDKWVEIGKAARSRTRTVASNLSFDQQCSHCEKESVNQSLINLLTFPWIKEGVNEGKLFIHGGHYNFVDCSFERWTLDFKTQQPQKLS